MQVCKWGGNSLAVRLPASVVKTLDLWEGDNIELFVEHERSFEVRKKAALESLLAKLREFRGKLPSDFKFDREDAHARE